MITGIELNDLHQWCVTEMTPGSMCLRRKCLPWYKGLFVEGFTGAGIYVGKVRVGNDTVARPYVVGPHNGVYYAMPLLEFLQADMFMAMICDINESLRAAGIKTVKNKVGTAVGSDNPYVAIADPLNILSYPRHSSCDADSFFTSHTPFAVASKGCEALRHFVVKRAETEISGYEIGLSSYWYAVSL
jgi:hypothetical protein